MNTIEATPTIDIGIDTYNVGEVKNPVGPRAYGKKIRKAVKSKKVFLTFRRPTKLKGTWLHRVAQTAYYQLPGVDMDRLIHCVSNMEEDEFIQVWGTAVMFNVVNPIAAEWADWLRGKKMPRPDSSLILVNLTGPQEAVLAELGHKFSNLYDYIAGKTGKDFPTAKSPKFPLPPLKLNVADL